MPEISRFLGISIRMYFNDHNPPHFHVKYGEHRASVAIADLRVLSGTLPARVLGLVVEWALQHRPELRHNWDAIAEDGTWRKIDPLV